MSLYLRQIRSFFILLLLLPVAKSFSAPSAIANKASAKDPSSSNLPFETKSVVSTVAVTGATGRTGQLVVQQLLDRGVSQVLAIVRDEEKAAQVFPDPPDNLKIVACDLTRKDQIAQVLQDADAAIWCATGFSSAQAANPLEQVKRALGLVLTPKQSIDIIGPPVVAEALAQNSKTTANGDASVALPKMVMCSSAGVTRSTWDAAKKERLVGAADIPIVRLNPFGILDVKRESEELLRQTCTNADIDYCIVRPTGLNDNWPAGSRPIFSQGDVAVGRINRQDVARVLVDVLGTPEAVGKTFEVFAVAGYPPAVTMRTALSRLRTDQQGPPSDETVAATYYCMQQLLPGEQQDSAALAMGQTYEQLDKGETGRLGERGQEAAEMAAPKPST